MAQFKVIIIEDDEILSRVITEELRDSGLEAIQAFDGVQGLKAVKEKKPDLVLLDIMMPKMNGFEVLGEISNDMTLKNIPVIMLTVLGSDDDIKKGLQMGAKDYIVKSQHAVAEIVEKVKQFLKKENAGKYIA